MPSPNTRTRLVRRGGKKVREHRRLMEQELGRRLLPTEHVHHKDGNPLNNDLSNLEVLDRTDHMRLHKCQPVEPRECAWCGVTFTPKGRKRHQYKTCSPKCAQSCRVDAALRARGLR